MNNKKIAIALFDNQEMIAEAVEKLHEGGYDMGHYTAEPDYHLLADNLFKYSYSGNNMKKCCAVGALVAGAWGLLFGVTLLFML